MGKLPVSSACCGCAACYNICPAGAIAMLPDGEGFLYPQLTKEKCMRCGACLKACPVLHPPAISDTGAAYACYAADFAEQMGSSSGGLFAVLAGRMLEAGGLISGAAFNGEGQVRHIVSADKEGLRCIRETKYVQSSIGRAYAAVKGALEEDKPVLFSGTACQVAGLKAYLGRSYDKLLTVDIICHGVPSPEVWRRYLEEISCGSRISRLSFRNKSRGIAEVTLDYGMEDGRLVQEGYGESLYIKGFISNLFIRPSCTACPFKGIARCSDITIGDFWGIDTYHPGFSNGYGTTAALVHSQKGKEWMARVAGSLKIREAASGEIASNNGCLLYSVAAHPKRQAFFRRIKTGTVHQAIEELADRGKPWALRGRLGAIALKIRRIVRRW